MATTLPAPHPFFSYGRLFRDLAAPGLADLNGDFQSALVGPGWFQSVSRFSLRYGGLPDWYGKRFDAAGKGINLLQQHGAFQTTMPMQVRVEPSRLDGKPAAVVHYGSASPLPWRHVIDELRVLEGDTLLGMTLLDLPLMRGLPLPFLLYRVRP